MKLTPYLAVLPILCLLPVASGQPTTTPAGDPRRDRGPGPAAPAAPDLPKRVQALTAENQALRLQIEGLRKENEALRRAAPIPAGATGVNRAGA